MTMTEYLPLAPEGLGSTEIEAFGSYFNRLAALHSVSVYAMTVHLQTWWERLYPAKKRGANYITNAMNPMLCGIGPNVSSQVEIVGLATGCTTLSRTTFLALKNAISPNGHALARKGRAWCPACLYEATMSDTVFYDRLLWAIPVTSRCQLHKIALTSMCPRCGRSQNHYHHRGDMTLCYACKHSLRSEPSQWSVELRPPVFEKECSQLIAQISNGSLTSAVDDAYGIFINAFSEYLAPLGLKISRHTYRARRRPAKDRETLRPRFMTLLRRCVSFGINPAHVLMDPIGAARSACLLEFARLELPPELKPRKAAELVDAAASMLQSGLMKQRYDELPSLVQIAQTLRLSKGFLHHHHRALCREYTNHRSRCRFVQAADQVASVVAYLKNGAVRQYPSPQFPSHDHLVSAVVRDLGVGVRVARLGVAATLKGEIGRRQFRKYRDGLQ